MTWNKNNDLDIVGQRSRTLEITEDLGRINGSHKARAVCRKCGAEKVIFVQTFQLNLHNCKCSHINWKVLPPGMASANSLLRQYKFNAAKKGLPFLLTDERFFELTKMNCYLCNDPPSAFYRHSKGCNGAYLYNGIDRVDNALGYTEENSRPCCAPCNLIKHHRTLDFLLRHLKKMWMHLSGSCP